jgi:hypothetical protein
VEQNNKREHFLFWQVVITTDVAPGAWDTTLQIIKDDKYFNPEKEIRKLTLEKVLQSTITKDGRVFCPTNMDNLKWKRKMKQQTSNQKELMMIRKLNTTTDKMNYLKMNGNCCLSQKTFQFIQKTLKCYPKINLLASKKNRHLQKYTSKIHTKNPNNIKNTLKIDWKKFHFLVLIHPPIPLILKNIQKLANEKSKTMMITVKWKVQNNYKKNGTNFYYYLLKIINHSQTGMMKMKNCHSF